MNKHSITQCMLVVCACLTPMFNGAFAQELFSGRVYEGAAGDQNTPISGVTVSLYGAKNLGETGIFLASTTTNSIGWYGLPILGTFEYYSIVETDPSGYTSVEARSVSGTVINSNMIQYVYPIGSKTLTGNKFWDQKTQVSNNPPVAEANGPYSFTVGGSITLDSNGSSDPDAGDSIAKYEWDTDNDGQYDDATGQTTPWTATTAGTYTVGLRVTDTHGATDTDQATITVRSAPSSHAGEIKGYKFNDANGDGIWGTGEQSLSGWTVFADKAPWNGKLDASETYDVTGADGSYSLSGLAPGTYNVYEVGQTGWQMTHPKAGYYGLTLNANDLYDDQNFGNRKAESPLNEGLDYGDAPAPYPEASDSVGTLWLGVAAPDAESKSLSDPNALGDDTNNIDDEDGITAIMYGSTTNASINGIVYLWLTNKNLNKTVFANVWVDFNADGDWVDPGERILSASFTQYAYCNIAYAFTASNVKTGSTFLRARVCYENEPWATAGSVPPNGSGGTGEVEDLAGIIPDGGTSSPPGGFVFGYKWNDLDGSGTWEAQAESPLAGWSIWLDVNGNKTYDAGIDSITQTDGSGMFMFQSLADGAYTVGEVMQPGWVQTYPRGVETQTVTVKKGSAQMGVIFGNRQTGTEDNRGVIRGWKFDDVNGDGMKDLLEPRPPNWGIWLDRNNDGVMDQTDDYTVTGNTGWFVFKNLPAGNYTVREIQKPGWTQTYPGQPPYHSVALQSGQTVTLLFGNQGPDTTEYDYGDAPLPYPEACHPPGGPWLGDILDAPDAENGMQRDPDATGDDNDGNDDEDGFSVFNGYFTRGGICMVYQDYTSSNPTAEVGCWIDINADGDWDDPSEFMGTIGIVSLHGTAGFATSIPASVKANKTFVRIRICDSFNNSYSPAGVGGPGEVADYEVEIRADGTSLPPGGTVFGRKWNDLNSDGIYDANEPTLANWTIWLDKNGNGTYDAGVDQAAQTDVKGNFLFTGLADGSYTVGEVMQPGWMQTFPGGAGTHTVTVKQGSAQTGILFGNREIRGSGEGQGALKWSQYPLRYPDIQDKSCFLGWGEPSTVGIISVADNWFCYNPRPVTSITWWGAYADWDSASPPPDAPIGFRIGVWTDAPIRKEGDVNHPDRMIREWFVGRQDTGERVHGCHSMPEWKGKPDSCFQYTFPIPQPEWFHQEGDSNVYWLSIAAMYPEPPQRHVWGWLTRERNFSGDAVRIYAPADVHADSVYRIGDLLPRYWDMAFVLGTDQEISMMDFGDAPDGFGTTLSRNGARHLIRPDVRMGESIDMDDEGHPDPQALGDDKNGSADEDGVTFLTDLVPGSMALASVTVTSRGFLNAWLDLGGNDEWDLRDHIVDNALLDAGSHVLEFPVADDARPGESIMRFRFSTQPDVWVKGFAPDGEVEDYQVVIVQRTDVEEKKSGTIPEQFKLYPNYPNPFNPATTIRFDLPEAGQVRLSVYNLLGQEVAVLADGKRSAGQYDVRWDGLDARHLPAPSGIYLVRIKAGSYVGKGKLLLLK
jgi:serine-aspartate repeat-containing protein C/D/E